WNDPRLRTTIAGIPLQNPLVVGAGWDKTGEAVATLHALGFAGVEVGTVVPSPQPGNPRPRQFVLARGVALNRLGFNSPGMNVVAQNLRGYCDPALCIGVSVGKNRTTPHERAADDHAAVAQCLAPFASYIAVDVSSPNTPGLRELQERTALRSIVRAVRQAAPT